jgi:hypothetical protein
VLFPVVAGLISRGFQVVVVSVRKMSSAAWPEMASISAISAMVARSSRWLAIHSAYR